MQAFSSRALLLLRANAERPHSTHRFFFRSILKELNADKEKFELGKSLFYIFMLFLVQLLQSIFVGRYLFAAQLIFHYYKPKLSIHPPFFCRYGVSRSSVHVKSAIQTTIFRKTLVLSAEARQKAEGNSDAIIHTLMRFHASNVSSFLLVFHLMIWSAPLQILLYGTRLHARAVLQEHAASALTLAAVLSSFLEICSILKARLRACWS